MEQESTMTHEEVVEELRNRLKPGGVHTIDTILTGILQEEFQAIDPEEMALVDRLGEHYRANYSSSKGRIEYDRVSLGYALHYMPPYYAKIQNMFLELFRNDLLPEHMKILDVGAGTGSAVFAAVNFFSTLSEVLTQFGERREFNLEIQLVERSGRNIEIFRQLWTKYKQKWSEVEDLWGGAFTAENVTVKKPKQDEVKPDIKIARKSYKTSDMVLFSHFLNEISGDKINILHEFMQVVKDDGSFVIIEPADKHGTKLVSHVRMFKKDLGWYVYSPCAIWHPFCSSQHEYTGDCAFCAISKPDIQPVRYNRRRSKTDMKYAYAILRQDGEHTHLGRPDEEYTKFSELHRIPNLPVRNVHVRAIKQREKNFVTRRIQGQDLHGASYYVCDGTSGRAHTQLVALGSKQRVIDNADDGDILDIQNAYAARAPSEDKWCIYEIIATEQSNVRIIENTL
ncbi:small ribosomal subunit Rsm22 family protein [Candidatus Woesearchaeota archaeon]|nr:small ribosomal subunit Rsm22 family protein [Candidatus Woesearchaeota archaeon]